MKVQWAKFIVVLVLYLLFLYWVKSLGGDCLLCLLSMMYISPRKSVGSGGKMPRVPLSL